MAFSSSWFFGDRRSTAELLNAVAEIKTSVTNLANSIYQRFTQLEEKVDDANAILPDRYVEGTLLASVNIVDIKGRSIGVAIFVSERRAISALHVFTSHYDLKQKENIHLNRDIAIYGILHRPEEQKENVQFRVVNHNNNSDLVVLELDDAYSDASYSLALRAVNVNQIWKGNISKIQTKRAVTAFTSAMAIQVPDAVDVSFCVIPVTLIKLTPHHLVYTSSLFSGDSDGALLIASDGSLRGVHQQTINQASEVLRTIASSAVVVYTSLSIA
jgi:hypothetical protein